MLTEVRAGLQNLSQLIIGANTLAQSAIPTLYGSGGGGGGGVVGIGVGVLAAAGR